VPLAVANFGFGTLVRSSSCRKREKILSELETIKTIIARAFFIPADAIADDADIAEIKGMDSLTFEALMLEIEEATGQEPDPVALMDVRTVADLARMIEEMKAAAQRA